MASLLFLLLGMAFLFLTALSLIMFWFPWRIKTAFPFNSLSLIKRMENKIPLQNDTGFSTYEKHLFF
jgi:hypothetical protein